MNSKIFLLAPLLLIAACSLESKSAKDDNANDMVSDSVQAEQTAVAAVDEEAADSCTDPRITALVSAYPDFISAVKNNKVIFKDGTSIVYDDGKQKTFDEKLDNSDVEDMFSLKYTNTHGTPEYLADAGRSRCEALFKKMYGSSSSAVADNLVSVNWFGSTIKFTKINGAAEQLKKLHKS